MPVRVLIQGTVIYIQYFIVYSVSKLNFNLSLTQTLHYYVIHRHAQSQCQLSINRCTDVPIAVMCTRHEISVCLHTEIKGIHEWKLPLLQLETLYTLI